MLGHWLDKVAERHELKVIHRDLELVDELAEDA